MREREEYLGGGEGDIPSINSIEGRRLGTNGVPHLKCSYHWGAKSIIFYQFPHLESVSISVCSKNFNSARVSNYYEAKSNLA